MVGSSNDTPSPLNDWAEQFDTERRHRFLIPNVTPKGQAVRIDRTERDGERRVHAYSADESELYFEVMSYPAVLQHSALSERLRHFLAQNAVDAAVTADQPVTVGQGQATAFEFSGALRGRHKVRRFLFIDNATRTFRVVYDPTSALNRRVLETLVLSD